MKIGQVFHILSLIIILIGFSMIPSLLISYGYKDGCVEAWSIFIILTISIAYLVYKNTRVTKEVSAKEGFCIVGLTWVVVSAIGAVPFLFSNTMPSYINAYFESMSGFSTTGASVFSNVEILPKSILFWRSFTHWLGGMGIIVLSIIILPLLGTGGVQLFKAEAPGPTTDKLTPKIAQTAKILWQVYVLFTLLEIILLYFGGMSWFDSACQTFGTMATGGFSTKNASIGAFNSVYIETVIMIFMVIASINFSLHFRFITGNFKTYVKNSELVFYIVVMFIAILLVTGNIWISVYKNFADAFRYGSFQVISLMSTTGFTTYDFDKWPAMSKLLLIVLMFFGGCLGSTSGGVKSLRVLLILKYVGRGIKNLIYPKAVLPVKVGNEVVPKEIMSNALSFFIVAMVVFGTAVIIMASQKLDIITSFSSVAATLWGVGPGLAKVGAAQNYAHITVIGKITLISCMLLGRLEFFTIILLFSPAMWKK
jgi:trk system potassium uptake protein